MIVANGASYRTNSTNRLPRLNRLFAPALLVGAFALTHCGKPAPSRAADAAVPTPVPADAAPAGLADVAAEPAPADCVPNEIATVIGTIDPELARVEGKTVELCGLVDEARMCTARRIDPLPSPPAPDNPAG